MYYWAAKDGRVGKETSSYSKVIFRGLLATRLGVPQTDVSVTEA